MARRRLSPEEAERFCGPAASSAMMSFDSLKLIKGNQNAAWR
jgi:hypothetical protein